MRSVSRKDDRAALLSFGCSTFALGSLFPVAYVVYHFVQFRVPRGLIGTGGVRERQGGVDTRLSSTPELVAESRVDVDSLGRRSAACGEAAAALGGCPGARDGLAGVAFASIFTGTLHSHPSYVGRERPWCHGCRFVTRRLRKTPCVPGRADTGYACQSLEISVSKLCTIVLCERAMLRVISRVMKGSGMLARARGVAVRCHCEGLLSCSDWLLSTTKLPISYSSLALLPSLKLTPFSSSESWGYLGLLVPGLSAYDASPR